MAHDFASRKRKKSQTEETERPRGAVPKSPEPDVLDGQGEGIWQRLPGWGWLGIGVVAGLLLAQVFSDGGEVVEPEVAEVVSEGQAVLVEEPQTTNRPRFDFYTLLPESEVIAPKIEAYQSTPRDAENQPSFMLQTGSFRQREDAVQQQQQLESLGFDNVAISPVESDSGRWYRVRVGPYQDRRLRARAQDDLAAAGVDFLLLSVRADAEPQQAAASTSAQASSEPEKPASPSSSATTTLSPEELAGLPRFTLQVGSFRQVADAERQRQRLAGLGFEDIAITGVQTASGDTWHRVQVGPYQDPAALTAAQETLKVAEIDYMLLRLREPEAE